METHRRKADGRRVFTPQFKQEQVARVERQELTVAELARELAVAPQLTPAVAAPEQCGQYGRGDGERRRGASSVSCGSHSSAFGSWSARLGKKVMEIEILQAARDEVKKRPRYYTGSRR